MTEDPAPYGPETTDLIVHLFPAELKQRAKVYAVKNKQSLKSVIEEALREKLKGFRS